jgi:hypothetical protein
MGKGGSSKETYITHQKGVTTAETGRGERLIKESA